MQPMQQKKRKKKVFTMNRRVLYSISAHEALVTMGSTGQGTGNVFGNKKGVQAFAIQRRK